MLRVKYEGITFDDVLIIPRKSQVLPNEVSLKTKLTNTISLNIPVVSAAMDTVSGVELCRMLALHGGLGFLHKNCSIEEQVDFVKQVKNTDPELIAQYPDALVDADGRLMIGAAIGSTEANVPRADALVAAGIDVLLIDSSHGHAEGVVNRVRETRAQYPDLQIVAGNVATGEAAIELVEAGANCVKVGIGPGSICTTRIVTGCGVPQLSAIDEAVNALKSRHIPVIADGGIRYSGDISKAIVAGAHCVMLGSILGKTEEAPGFHVKINGEIFKSYRGMGSLAAMSKGSSERYFQSDNAKDKLVPEGVEGLVKLSGTVSSVIHQLMGGVRSAMGLTGCHNIEEMRVEPEFVKISNSGLAESHVHGISIDKQAPNYSR